MKKRFWTRLIAAVLTTAMAFSILAVPASAASNSWALGYPTRVPDEKGTDTQTAIMWMTTAALREDDEDLEMTDEELLALVKEQLAGGDGMAADMKLYEGEIPTGAYFGLSKSEDSKIFWYEKEAYDYEDGDETFKVDLNTGTLTLGKKTFYPINKAVEVSSSGSSDGSAVIIVAVAGAAAAATGVYFYTHPEKWQEIKDYFADLSANVQAKFQDFTDGVKGALGIPTEEAETAETVENAAVPQDAAA